MWFISRTRHGFNAEIVCLIFIIAAITGQYGRAADINEVARGTAVNAGAGIEHRPQNTGHHGRADGRRMAARTMARRNMSDFMADNTGQFGFIIGQGQEPPRHISIAAGQGESIDHRRVENGDAIINIGAVGKLTDARHHRFDISGELGIFIDTTIFADDIGVLLRADFRFIGFAHQCHPATRCQWQHKRERMGRP